MSEFWVHYDPANGDIVGWETTDQPRQQAGFEMVKAVYAGKPIDAQPDPDRQRIDLRTLYIVDRTPAEVAAAAEPTVLDVRCAVAAELSDSDIYIGLSDFPITPEKRATWVTYRQTLRDLSKGSPAPTAAEMLTAFPVRPDGVDAAAELRLRCENAKNRSQ